MQQILQRFLAFDVRQQNKITTESKINTVKVSELLTQNIITNFY